MSSKPKRNRRFIRIQSRRKWKQEKKIRKEIQRGKETVLNLSKRTLNSAEYRLLGKGLKFCPKPKHHNEIQLRIDVFEFTRKLRLKEFFGAKEEEDSDSENDTEVSNDAYQKFPKKSKSTFIPPSGRDSTLDFYIEAITHEILHNNKRYKYRSNLSTEEQNALTSLRQDRNIVIKKADKSSTIVIMNREDYIAEVDRQLNDQTYYEKLPDNPHEQFKKEIQDAISEIQQNKKLLGVDSIDISNENKIPQFCILPKTHKPYNASLPLGYPGRPIVSACGSLTENVSAYIDTTLKSHMESLPSYIKDTTDFINKIRQLPRLSKDSFLVTLDVSSFYSNIPHKDGIEACEYFMSKNGCASRDSVQGISKLIELVLTKNHFQFNDEDYIQRLGTAMGTRMAPSYASLFMGKFEKDFLESCGVQPLLWLRFLDDIFMIWDDSEEKLLQFFKEINKFHETIKFTYNYSKTNAVFLDVKIEKSQDGNLCTSVFEKDTNVHQYVEFSSCHPLSCKKGIPYSQAKRYRRITSDNDNFKRDLNRLETYFQTRNYPADILSEAIQKASNLTVEEALMSNSCKQNNQSIIPFICSYNPSLPNIGKIINQYWGLLKISASESVRRLFESKPIVAYKRPTNIHDILVHTKMGKQTASFNVTKCNRKRCSHCSTINESDCFTSTNTASVHKVNYDLSCTSTSVIYLITCKKCKAQYVGQTRQKCANRMNNHKYDIAHFPDTFTNVSEHFNSAGHSIQDFSFMPIDRVTNDWKRLLKETTWMHVLDTVSPNGMNSKVLF